MDFTQQSQDYQRIEKALLFVEENFRSQPDIAQIAESVCLSKHHFSRIFKRWAGISPLQFMQLLTLAHTKEKLAVSNSILDAAMDSGLSGGGRLHDLFVTFDAMTPGEFKRRGGGVRITYGFSPTPFGECLLATTDKGICHLGFMAAGKRDGTVGDLQAAWPDAEFREDKGRILPIIEHIFHPPATVEKQPFHLHLKGTNFQVNVWRALLDIPAGHLVSYQDIARYIGRPTAVRAAAHAIAVNPIAFLIPCHRVIAKSGKIHQYRWGAVRKKAIIGWEAAEGERQS